MPDLLTPQALAAAGPLILETLIRHFFSPKQTAKRVRSKAREDDILYDEAFVLMKTFLEIATHHPVAALQRFGLVRTPTPPWVALHRVIIPQDSLSLAADRLVEGFGGEEMAYKIAGGSKWWQVRAGPGVEAEWIVMKKDWREVVEAQKRDQELHRGVGEMGEDGGVNDQGEFRKEMDELRCMLYIHGGGSYWGSINTHRYTIWRYARKMHGRCFAVNYRKAPQYPFPCAIQDCLAAYIYLINPPPEAKHRPVDPKTIVLAGDSAGGNLVLALLQILRDDETLPLPAGAVLISPWSDLTHSFPSILENTATDIVPPYSFIHKPSSLWPPPPPDLTEEMQHRLRSRVKETVTKLRQGGADGLSRQMSRLGRQSSSSSPERHLSDDHRVGKGSAPAGDPGDVHVSAPQHGDPPQTARTRSLASLHDHPAPHGEKRSNPPRVNPADFYRQLQDRDPNDDDPSRLTTLAQCHKPMKLLVEGKEVVLDTQIQLYATNAQLCHPWVSPVLGYLGGLPPLFIECGDKEVLRDEIIYVAHKAANPDDFPIRDDDRAMLPSLQGIEKRHGPTQVHLQVYDGVCHDLPLFSMTKPARGVFRAIASFARYCTPSAPGSLDVSQSAPPTPPLSASTTPRSHILSGQESDGMLVPAPATSSPPLLSPKASSNSLALDHRTAPTVLPPGTPPSRSAHPVGQRRGEDRRQSLFNKMLHLHKHSSKRDSRAGTSNEIATPSRAGMDTPVTFAPIKPLGPPASGADRMESQPPGDDAGPRFTNDPAFEESGGESTHGASSPIVPDTPGGSGGRSHVAHEGYEARAPPGTAGNTAIYAGPDPFGPSHMIRERVSTTGVCRPLEPPSELQAMTMPRDEIGTIKEGPALRYLKGQQIWDKRYKRTIKKVGARRRKNIKESRERDAKKIVSMWKERLQKRDKVRSTEAAKKYGKVWRDKTLQHQHPGEDGWETDRDGDGEGDREWRNAVLDKSWSWRWALDGEAPPPSAIVSRRDFGEARNLALMADRMDDQQHSHAVSGLSIWVGLTSFFSSSAERNKARDAVRQAREVRKAEEGEDPGKPRGVVHRLFHSKKRVEDIASADEE